MNLPKPRKIKVERYVGGLSQFKKIENPIKLSANESALGPSPKAIAAFKKNKDKIFKYPESDAQSLREAISKKFKIKPERIICGAGSDQIFDLTCQLFIEPGDEVVMGEFNFIMHRIYSTLYGAKVQLAKEKNLRISVNALLEKVTKKTKLIFISNPNNPTGTYLTEGEMLDLRKKLRSDILLVIDDAYFEFLGDKKDFKSGVDLFKNEDNVLITRTFSKVYGLAGLRLGWGYSSKTIIDSMYQIKPPFNVNSAALVTGIEALKDNDWTKKAVMHNTLWSKNIFSILNECKIQTNGPTANFFLMNFDKTKINSDQAFNNFANEGILLRKMFHYNLPNTLRLTIGNKKSNLFFIKCMKGIFK